MDPHYTTDGRYAPPPQPPPQAQQPGQQQQQQQQQQWGQHHQPQLHLQVPQTLSSSTFPSPVSPSPSDYPPYYPQHPHPHAHPHDGAALSLNLSGLSVASPTNISPIHPSPHPSTSSTMSPITPITPPHAHPAFAHPHIPHPHQHPHPHAHHFSFNAPPYDEPALHQPQYVPSSSRSSSCSEKSVPRKRSFSTTPLATSLEEAQQHQHQHQHQPMDYDDGSTSSGEMDDKPALADAPEKGGQYGCIPPGAINILGKPAGTNNFVTKLYQMINDPKSAQFIAWTELGTSFVVSNVGEFSRSILGSHFKHNNFSSFVRQLNMYGFHKINRTPRAQRTSTDAQTWEFSHHKFLRGRPDLLDEIKRKALEPDPGVKHRVELPGEVAAQLGQMREEHRRTERELEEVRRRCERLGGVVGALWEAVGKGGVQLPFPFPSDLLEPLSPSDTAGNSPNIYVTQPASATTSQQHNYPTPTPSSSFSLPALQHHPSLHSLHSVSPGSSPTAGEFPAHVHGFAHAYDGMRYDSPSPQLDDGGGRPGSSKRQRVAGQHHEVLGAGAGAGGAKRLARARSDSAPLGYALGGDFAGHGRPRSGSGLGARGMGRRPGEEAWAGGAVSRGGSGKVSPGQ